MTLATLNSSDKTTSESPQIGGNASRGVRLGIRVSVNRDDFAASDSGFGVQLMFETRNPSLVSTVRRQTLTIPIIVTDWNRLFPNVL